MNSKVLVTPTALLARVNRRLAAEGQVMRKTRPGRSINDLGSYYIIDTSHNVILFKDIDLEAVAQELGAIKGWERVAE